MTAWGQLGLAAVSFRNQGTEALVQKGPRLQICFWHTQGNELIVQDALMHPGSL